MTMRRDEEWLKAQAAKRERWRQASLPEVNGQNSQGAIVDTDQALPRVAACPAPKANSLSQQGAEAARVSLAAAWPLINACRNYGLPEPIPEYQFHPVRKWRFDYAWPLQLVAVEINGGVWTSGRHTRGQGYLNDREKINEAQLLGWRVLEYSPDQIGRAMRDLRLAFAAKR